MTSTKKPGKLVSPRKRPKSPRNIRLISHSSWTTITWWKRPRKILSKKSLYLKESKLLSRLSNRIPRTKRCPSSNLHGWSESKTIRAGKVFPKSTSKTSKPRLPNYQISSQLSRGCGVPNRLRWFTPPIVQSRHKTSYPKVTPSHIFLILKPKRSTNCKTRHWTYPNSDTMISRLINGKFKTLLCLLSPNKRFRKSSLRVPVEIPKIRLFSRLKPKRKMRATRIQISWRRYSFTWTGRRMAKPNNPSS